MQLNLKLTFTIVMSICLLNLSCKKSDWKFIKYKAFYAIFADCSVKRVYGPVPGVGEVESFHKEYDSRGLVSSLTFPIYMGAGPESWRTYSLHYRPDDFRVDFYNESGALAYQVFLYDDGRIKEAKGSMGDPSIFADLKFEYAAGRLARIRRTLAGFPVNIQTFTYDASGNIIKSVELDEGLTSEDDASYRLYLTYGTPTPGKRQFYTEFNNRGFSGSTLAVLEYLGWIRDFWPKNLLVHTEFLWAPGEGGGGDISGHIFDAEGKLVKWGGTVNLEWFCPGTSGK